MRSPGAETSAQVAGTLELRGSARNSPCEANCSTVIAQQNSWTARARRRQPQADSESVTPIDFDSDVPAFEQIKQLVTFGIARGSYAPGEKLPSVRGFARKLLVNPNTIVRVYRELEQSGLVRTRQGKGVFVADAALDLCEGAGIEAVEKALRDALALAEQAGVKGRALDALYRRLRAEQSESSEQGKHHHTGAGS